MFPCLWAHEIHGAGYGDKTPQCGCICPFPAKSPMADALPGDVLLPVFYTGRRNMGFAVASIQQELNWPATTIALINSALLLGYGLGDQWESGGHSFVKLMAKHGVPVTEAEARRPRELHNRDHIRATLADPAIGERWTAANRRVLSEDVIGSLYTALKPGYGWCRAPAPWMAHMPRGR